ncbi:mutarotase [Hymenobacter sp. BRD128]|uniref:2'-5' RNA ligase family protein n=1 Tax=Hymenobacter sp. BRD128 TaxID=2675878 RepID=UPI0015656671|nr:mutarotase [Hymenobacter sp. BRD128]QKG56539.1 mutarotase [Hymenobacter sp. BRD128]
MTLAEHYTSMREAAVRQLAHGAADLDPLIDSLHDDRRGITLLARPPAAITTVMEAMLADFRRIDPAQYYYPASDIHLTILSIISCYSGFTLRAIDPDAYRATVQTSLQDCRAFPITYAGLTASPGSIMVQGFPQDDGLASLRNTTRRIFQSSGLQQSIDQRYRLQTAHSTVIRFRKPLANPALLLAVLRKYEQHFVGTFEVNTVELVYNDWYQRAPNTVLLAKYAL